MAPAWQSARIEDVPSDHGPEFWAQWAEDPAFGTRWHSLRTHLGITAFGANANAADAGGELVVGHDENAFGGQEELYVVLRGRARFELDGAELELGELEVVRVGPEVTRRAVALATPTIVLTVGAVPGTFTPDW
jgi:uncharacterized cupin superfamily protein